MKPTVEELCKELMIERGKRFVDLSNWLIKKYPKIWCEWIEDK